MTQFENICRKTDSQHGFTYYMVKNPKCWGFTDTVEIDGSRGHWIAKTWKGLGRLDQQRLRRQADYYKVKLTDVSDDFTVVAGEVQPRMSIIAEAKTLKELDAKLTGEIVRKVIEDGNVFYLDMMEKLDPAFGGGIDTTRQAIKMDFPIVLNDDDLRNLSDYCLYAYGDNSPEALKQWLESEFLALVNDKCERMRDSEDFQKWRETQ